MRNGFRALIFTFLVLCSGGVQALGLGEPSVKSFLNQPLEVEIELLSLTTAEAESVIARLASVEDYQRIGSAQMRLSVPLNFTVFATSARTFILVESSDPVHDPVVQLLLDVNWSGGRLLKEYTLFLDPPTIDLAPPRVSLQPRTEPEPDQQPAQAQPQQSEAPRQASAPRIVTSADSYGPVQSGETLWRIATDWIAGSGYTVNQAMVTIALANPQAFRNGNINRMQRGEVLRMPEQGEVGRISRGEANRTVTEHTDAWRRNIPLTAPPPVVSDAGTDADRAADSVEDADIASDAAESEATPEVSAPQLPQARLELVPTEVDVDDFLSGQATADSERRAQLSLVQELLHRAETAMRTGDGENEALAAEIENLRATVLELSRAMNIDDQDLATLAARTRETRNQAKDESQDSVDDLFAEAQGIVDDQGVADDVGDDAADEPQPAEAAEIDDTPAPSWWEQTWFIALLGAILLIGIVMLLRRGAKASPGDYGQRSLADALIEEEEEHVDYSAADIPGVEPETADDDLSTLTEEAENILKALEEENQEERGDDPESIYEPPVEEEDFTVEIDGTTVSTINVDEDELAQLMAENRSEDEDAGEPEDGSGDEQAEDEVPEGEDAMESKLDLAIAYIESDDKDKARELLTEVEEGGDKDQKAMAKKLLTKFWYRDF